MDDYNEPTGHLPADKLMFASHYRWEDKGYDVITEVAPFAELCENVIRHDANVIELSRETPAQTAVLRFIDG